MALVRGSAHPSAFVMVTAVSPSNCEHSIYAAEEQRRLMSGLSLFNNAARSYDTVAPLLYGMIIKVIPCETCADSIFQKVFHSTFACSETDTPSTAELVRRAFTMIVETTSGNDREDVISRISEIGSTIGADRFARA